MQATLAKYFDSVELAIEQNLRGNHQRGFELFGLTVHPHVVLKNNSPNSLGIGRLHIGRAGVFDKETSSYRSIFLRGLAALL